MIRYTFRDDEPIGLKGAKDGDAQTIGEELEKIAASGAGELRPAAVVEAARSPSHPLHRHFEWDDRFAAEAHRLDQARRLIRIIRVEDALTEDGTSRAFISVGDKRGTSYRPLADVKRDVGMQDTILKAALRDVQAFQKRYRNLADVCEAFAAAEAAIKRRQAKQDESRAP